MDPEPARDAAALAAKDAEIVALQRQSAIDRVVGETGLPAEMFSAASTPEEIDTIAGSALAWRIEGNEPPPAPPLTAAVSASLISSSIYPEPIAMATGQIRSRDQLAALPPAERMRAWREGRLQHLGVGQPPSPAPTPLHRRR